MLWPPNFQTVIVAMLPAKTVNLSRLTATESGSEEAPFSLSLLTLKQPPALLVVKTVSFMTDLQGFLVLLLESGVSGSSDTR